MKKHNEGYTLVLVLVVMLVLTTVATAILTFSVSNLKNQQAMVERMEAKYEAMGALEVIESKLHKIEIEGGKKGESAGDIIKEQINEQINEICNNESFADMNITVTYPTWNESTSGTGKFEENYTFLITVQKNGVSISCKWALILKGDRTEKTVSDVTEKTYTFSEITFDYASYDISTVISTDNNQESTVTTTSEEGGGSE